MVWDSKEIVLPTAWGLLWGLVELEIRWDLNKSREPTAHDSIGRLFKRQMNEEKNI